MRVKTNKSVDSDGVYLIGWPRQTKKPDRARERPGWLSPHTAGWVGAPCTDAQACILRRMTGAESLCDHWSRTAREMRACILKPAQGHGGRMG